MLLGLVSRVFFDLLMLDVCILLRSQVNYFGKNGAKDTGNTVLVLDMATDQRSKPERFKNHIGSQKLCIIMLNVMEKIFHLGTIKYENDSSIDSLYFLRSQQQGVKIATTKTCQNIDLIKTTCCKTS